MARLTNTAYLERHRFLRWAWLESNGLYGELPAHRQWDVHAFYQPSKEITGAALLEHRRAITAERPGLPASAGRAFSEMYEMFLASRAEAKASAQHGGQREIRSTSGKRQIRVRGIAHPEPDLGKLARALIELAQHMAEEEQRAGGRQSTP